MTETPVNPRLERRYWPAGFDSRPWRLLAEQPVWRALLWTLFLAVAFVPALVATVMLLPWLPLSARASDLVGRFAARWMKVPVTPRRVNHWFDWRQSMELVAQLTVAFSAFALTVCVGTVVVYLATFPFTYRGTADGTLSFGFWETDWTPAVFTVSWILTVVAALVFLYASWLITGCSVASAVLSNTSEAEEIAELNRSRAVLADAFTGERHRIERELHDGPQQYLTALQLNAAAAELAAQHGRDITEELEKVRINARRALESLRSTVRGIYPQVLEDHGLAEAVQELIAHSGIEGEVLDLRRSTNQRLSDTSALLLYHCTAEGMTNAVRHAQATAVRICLSETQTTTVLTVDDNGQGLLGDSPVSTAGGTGIAGLRERAAALGGTVTLSSIPGASWTTRLEMTLP